MSLYRQYRPRTFNEVVGQKHVIETLTNALTHDAVSHAYLFTGPRGTGKTSTARLLAKSLNCENRQGAEPCNECASCKQITEGSLLDVLEIDAASNRGIDEIRELRDTIRFQPSVGHVKVYIIDEVHMLTKEAFNALLKTLEEPPEYAYFVLATTEVEKIPETILSRCQRFDFYRLQNAEIIERLQEVAAAEKREAPAAVLELVAREAHGGVRDALSLFEQLMSASDDLNLETAQKFLGYTDSALCEQFIDKIKEQDSAGAVSIVQDLEQKGGQFERFYQQVITLMREQFLAALTAGDNTGWYVKAFKVIEEQHNLFRTSEFPQLTLEVAAALLCESAGSGTAAAPKVATKVKSESVGQTLAENNMRKPVKNTTAEDLPKKKPTKLAKAETVAIPENTGQTIDLKTLKHDWPKIVDRVPAPSLRLSLKQAQVIDSGPGAVTLGFVSSFHMEQVNKVKNLQAVHKAIEAHLGADLSVIIRDKLLNDSEVDEPIPADSFVDSTMDLFADL